MSQLAKRPVDTEDLTWAVLGASSLLLTQCVRTVPPSAVLPAGMMLAATYSLSPNRDYQGQAALPRAAWIGALAAAGWITAGSWVPLLRSELTTMARELAVRGPELCQGGRAKLPPDLVAALTEFAQPQRVVRSARDSFPELVEPARTSVQRVLGRHFGSLARGLLFFRVAIEWALGLVPSHWMLGLGWLLGLFAWLALGGSSIEWSLALSLSCASAWVVWSFSPRSGSRPRHRRQAHALSP